MGLIFVVAIGIIFSMILFAVVDSRSRSGS